VALMAALAGGAPLIGMAAISFYPGGTALFLIVAAAVVVGAVAATARRVEELQVGQKGLREGVMSFVNQIEAADTRALELTVKMLTDVQEGANEASNAAGVMGIIEDNTRSIATTSQQMSANVNVVATAAEEISANINSVANTSEEISSNMSAVATTSEQMSRALATIDHAIRELSTAINGIAGNAREGATVAGSAAEAATAMMKSGKTAPAGSPPQR